MGFLADIFTNGLTGGSEAIKKNVLPQMQETVNGMLRDAGAATTSSDKEAKAAEQEHSAVILQPDIADAALRAATAAKLRKARGGSTRQSFMGQAADTSAIGSW